MVALLKAATVPLLVYAAFIALFVVIMAAYEPIRVAGGSMEPALTAGDIAIVERGGDFKAGDIALVREPGHQAMLHRIVGTSVDGSLRLKGDANPIEDLRPVKAAHVVGTVERVIPAGAVLSRWRRE